MSIDDVTRVFGIERRMFLARIRRGFTHEAAAMTPSGVRDWAQLAEMAKRMHANGSGLQAIAGTLGIWRGTVRKWVKEQL